MSVTCPKCNTEIEQDFGLVNCPGCNTVLAIDVEGNVQVAEGGGPQEAPEGLAGFESPPEAAEISDGEFQDLDELMGTSAVAAASDLTRGASAMQASMDIAEKTKTNYQASMEVPDQAMTPAGDLEHTPEPVSGAGALDEITEFGNKDTSTGPFTYTLVLENIDLGETRQRLEEAVSQPRFGWDVVEIMKQVRSGKLTLEGLSPAQAVMLIRLLRGSQIQISWSQHVYS